MIAAPMIEIQAVSKRYGKGPAVLETIDLYVSKEEFVTLIGPSGCGKSTVLKLISGLTAPSGGTLRVDGMTAANARGIVSYIFQDATLLPWRTIRQNVGLGLELEGASKKRRSERTDALLELVGLRQVADAYPRELSGGMKMRASIARAMATNPRLLLMDEPFAALDEQTRMTMGDELLRIWAATGKTVVFVTHSLTEAVYLADEVIVMSARPGRIVDQLTIPLPRPRTYEMLSGDTFGTLRDRIWRHIRKSA